MTEFSNNIEQDFLKVLLALSKNIEVNIGTFVSECILKEERAIYMYKNKVELFLNIEKERPEDFVNDLSIVVSLIETLKKNNLIFTHINPQILENKISTKSNNPDEYLALTSDNKLQERYLNNSKLYAKWELPTTLGNYIIKYVDEFCYVRPELTEYINNGFVSKEEQRFKTTLKWTYIATFIAFLGLIIAITLPFFTNTTIEKTQFDEIKKSIEKKEFKLEDKQIQQIIESNKHKAIVNDSLKIK